MSNFTPQIQRSESQPFTGPNRAGLLLQRKCACGSPATSLTDECSECMNEKRLQARLRIGASGDPLEREADAVADQVMKGTTRSAVSAAPPQIHRYAERAGGQLDAVPAGVEEVLASSGGPLNPGLRQEMEQRIGHDFSRVRIHSDAAAQRSAEQVNAHAYTVGHDIVFGAGRFAPGTREGRHLIAHELTHVVQQRGAPLSVQRAPASGGAAPRLTISDIDIKSNDPDCQYQKGEAEKSRSPEGILPNDIERAEFFGMEPADAVVIADFKVNDGSLRPSTQSLFRKYWLPTFDKRAMSAWEIVGFNDCVGWENANKVLREQRARAVARLLPGMAVSAAAVNDYPVANTSERGRALNRSVMIRPKVKVPQPPPPEPTREVTIKTEEPDTKNCSDDQRRQLSIAFPAAKLMAQRALTAVTSADKGPVIKFLLQRYFGDDALSHLPEIRDGFSKILGGWKDWDSRFDCETQTEGSCPTDKPHWITFAYVKAKRHIFSPNQAFGTVHVCAAAFDNASNMQQLSAIVLHELSHRLDNTDDKKYCPDSDGWCSTLSTKAAIDNADSYAQFAREILNASM
ncbi:MAG: peptidase superfamily protein [Gemmatimonadetes bacterium]|nr:peptidase superfamily protein [Gemmatimonadota bacterium]